MFKLYRQSFAFPKRYFMNRLTLSLKTYYAQKPQPNKEEKHEEIFQPQINTPNDNFKRFALLMTAGILGGLFGYYFFGRKETPYAQVKVNPIDRKSSLGGNWRLQNTQSKIFTSNQLRGSFYLLYFGYALCPDVCPTTLKYLANVKRHFTKEKTAKVQIVFVSLDPARDKPEGIRSYLDLFDHSFIGLTAKDENDQDFKEMKAKFKVYANKIKTQGEGYNIDHTSLVFIMGPNSEFVDILNTSLPQKQAAEIIKAILSR